MNRNAPNSRGGSKMQATHVLDQVQSVGRLLAMSTTKLHPTRGYNDTNSPDQVSGRGHPGAATCAEAAMPGPHLEWLGWAGVQPQEDASISHPFTEY